MILQATSWILALKYISAFLTFSLAAPIVVIHGGNFAMNMLKA
jgi:hypothetical protein